MLCHVQTQRPINQHCQPHAFILLCWFWHLSDPVLNQFGLLNGQKANPGRVTRKSDYFSISHSKEENGNHAGNHIAVILL